MMRFRGQSIAQERKLRNRVSERYKRMKTGAHISHKSSEIVADAAQLHIFTSAPFGQLHSVLHIPTQQVSIHTVYLSQVACGNCHKKYEDCLSPTESW